MQLFSDYSSALYFLGQSILAQKLFVNVGEIDFRSPRSPREEELKSLLAQKTKNFHLSLLKFNLLFLKRPI